jgi:hypothetical protein
MVRWRICALRVREGREKTLYGSKGRFFPHLPGKSLISRKSRTISSESRLFNGLRLIEVGKIFSRASSVAFKRELAFLACGRAGLFIGKLKLVSDFLQAIVGSYSVSC